MEIILQEDVQGLGYKYDVVKVKDGFGRNYLIPNKLAIVANLSNRKQRDETIRQAGQKLSRLRDDAQAMANRLAEVKIVLRTKVGDSGKIFGSITNLQLAEELTKLGFEIDRRKISIPPDVKAIGEYTAEVDLHREIKGKVPFSVEAE